MEDVTAQWADAMTYKTMLHDWTSLDINIPALKRQKIRS